uniref:Uncharacterized protein n=1 Tax=Arundo donax TaxID=35708 RepID=A0A0A9DUN2_ARUDO
MTSSASISCTNIVSLGQHCSAKETEPFKSSEITTLSSISSLISPKSSYPKKIFSPMAPSINGS